MRVQRYSGPIALVLASLSFLGSVILWGRDEDRVRDTRQNRVESIALICDQNDILVTFIKAPPDLPRDAPALRRLRAERCDEILSEARRLRGQVGQP